MDFTRKRTSIIRPVSILGRGVYVVEEYQYLGVHVYNRLNWKTNTEAVNKKACRAPEKGDMLQYVQQKYSLSVICGHCMIFRGSRGIIIIIIIICLECVDRGVNELQRSMFLY